MPYPGTPAAFGSYPISIGAKQFALLPNGHKGPNPYAVLPAGDVLQAKDFGFKYIEHVFPSLTSDGLYRVEVLNPINGPVTSVVLRWVVVATNAEAGAINLSGSTVNLVAIGS